MSVPRELGGLCSVALLLGLGASRPATGQALPNGAQFQVNGYTTGAQIGALVAAGPTGEFVVAWESEGGPGQPNSYLSAQAQPFPAQGPPSIEQFGLPTVGIFGWPAGVGFSDDGRFTVAWSSYVPPPGPVRNGWGRRFEGDGTPVGAPFELVDEDVLGDLAVGPSGDFVVVWPKLAVGPDSLQAGRFLADGSAAGAPVQVNAFSATPAEPRIATARDGTSIVVWWQSTAAGGNDVDGFSVQGRRLDADGAPIGPQFQINSYTTGLQWRPEVAVDATGGFVVVWQSDGSSGNDVLGASVQARRFEADGTPHPEFQVNVYTTGDQSYPSVAMDASGDFVVVWAGDGSLGGDDSGRSIHARRYDAGGIPRGGEFLVNSYTTGDQDDPDVAMDASGNFVVVWQSDGSPEDDADWWSIQGQRYDALFRDSFELGGTGRWHLTVP